MLPSFPQLEIPYDLWSHLASYASGFIGGLAVIFWCHFNRQKMKNNSDPARESVSPAAKAKS